MLDNIDRQIIQKLSADARTPFLSIAKDLSISEGTVRLRVLKLQKSGVIKKFSVVLGTSTTAMVEITTSSNVPTQKISEKIKKIGVSQVYEVTGRFTIVAIVQAEDLKKLNIVLEQIRSIDGVLQTETFPVLKEY
jgi:DNA-binding Lrp family transcriptional regulator